VISITEDMCKKLKHGVLHVIKFKMLSAKRSYYKTLYTSSMVIIKTKLDRRQTKEKRFSAKINKTKRRQQ
jgi:CII-binding regulator of phage lambda lysogenization HflD